MFLAFTQNVGLVAKCQLSCGIAIMHVSHSYLVVVERMFKQEVGLILWNISCLIPAFAMVFRSPQDMSIGVKP